MSKYHTLYLECTAGISGDMTVAALLDLGADQAVLEKALSSIHDKSFSTKISRVNKSGIDCCDFDVILDEESDGHDHDMEYLHGHMDEEEYHHHDHDHGHHHHGEALEEGHDHHDDEKDHLHDEDHHDHDEVHVHEHDQDGEHHHDHDHEEEHHHDHEHSHGHHHHHEHRSLPDIERILAACEMTESARALAQKIFRIVAEAEAKAHNKPLNEVHFHEVGAIDSIVDIVAVSVCFDNLGIQRVIIPKLCEGVGTVRCQHGILPIPVPATLNIVNAYHLPLHITEDFGEYVTPTGAAIAAAIMTDTHLPEVFRVARTGYGAGKRTYSRPSILRAMLIEDPEESDPDIAGATGDVICKLESNIDDCTGETLGYVMERLLAEGARDVNYSPVFMKKNRPAYQLNVICSPEDVRRMEEIIFTETTTIGVRRAVMERTVLARESRTVTTSYGEAQVKVCSGFGQTHFYPEYDSVREIASQNGISFMDAYNAVLKEC